MGNTVKPSYSDAQLAGWLRGLLTIAWSDGDYEEHEKDLIANIAKDLAITDDSIVLKTITPDELVAVLGKDPHTGENFLRTAVMVAVADGTYSTQEAELLHQFSEAFGLKLEALESLEHTLYQPEAEKGMLPSGLPQEHPHPDLLNPVKHWLDGMDIRDPRLAKFLCKMIPPQCPFERDVKVFGYKIVHIPPLCKLNPLYEQLVGLRFRSLSYLADDCKEDISEFI